MQERETALAAAAEAHEALAANYAGLLASAHAAKLGLDAACAHHAPVLAVDETRVRQGKALPATIELCSCTACGAPSAHKHMPMPVECLHTTVCSSSVPVTCVAVPNAGYSSASRG